MFGLRGRDTFNKPTSDISSIMKKMREMGAKAFPYAMAILVIIIVSVIGYVWYVNMNTKDVTAEERKQYIDKKNKETLFKKEKFDELKKMVLLRQERFDESRSQYNDIFYNTGIQGDDEDKDDVENEVKSQTDNQNKENDQGIE